MGERQQYIDFIKATGYGLERTTAYRREKGNKQDLRQTKKVVGHTTFSTKSG